MDILKTGLKITKTVRNVSRAKEIITVFAKNGFQEFFTRTANGLNFKVSSTVPKISQEISSNPDKWGAILGKRLRMSFEELGPTFIKIGQLLSTRVDLFDESFILEMKLLQENVKPVSFNLTKKILEDCLGKKIEEVFSEFDENPIGTASIGIVYKAKLKNGKKVAVKVKRPDIENIIQTDFSILIFLISQIEKLSSEIEGYKLPDLFEEFATHTLGELNFLAEAQNAIRYKELLGKHDPDNLIKIPEVYMDFSCTDIIVMEYLKGESFGSISKKKQTKKEHLEKLEEALKIYSKAFFAEGLYHADPHSGNFFFLDNGQIGIIDFGLMGVLSGKNKKSLLSIFYSLSIGDYDRLSYEFLDITDYDQVPDIENLSSDINDALAHFMGISVSNLDTGKLFKCLLGILRDYKMQLPRQWHTLIRMLITLDGVGKSFGVDFDVVKTLSPDVSSVYTGSLNKDEILKELFYAGKDTFSLLEILPKNIKWILKSFAKRNYVIEVKNTGHEDLFKIISNALFFLGFMILISTCLFLGAWFLPSLQGPQALYTPSLAWFFWPLSFVLLFRAFLFMNKK